MPVVYPGGHAKDLGVAGGGGGDFRFWKLSTTKVGDHLNLSFKANSVILHLNATAPHKFMSWTCRSRLGLPGAKRWMGG